MAKLTFQPFSSILNPGFWQKFTSIKLDKLKLNEDPHILYGTYSCNLARDLPCLASFDHTSFDDTPSQTNKFTCSLNGKLICMNLMQDFIDYDKKAFLNSLGQDIWNAICDGTALLDPEKYLSKCGLIVYADLKKYRYYYWFSFPAINHPKEVFLSPGISESRLISDYLNDHEITQLQEQYKHQTETKSFQRGYFIVSHNSSDNLIECHPLSDYHKLDKDSSSLYFAFTDPSADPVHPGWPLRNYLALISVQYQLTQVRIIRIRRGSPANPQSKLELQQSMVLSVTYGKAEHSILEPKNLQCPIVTGWERNESLQMAPKRVNLESVLNPKKIAEDAVNLNLRLMKWRLVPTLNLEGIANTKCLILGCGTLGCHIARGLLAWGVKHISLVDNSKISYSNPVRQSLYTFDDCVQTMGGDDTYKAEAAASSLRRIHPTVQATSHILSIPMPGHHIAKNEIAAIKSDVERLEQLIENHDAVFLLMDTRESRWLPSVVGLSKQKLVINAAIGFDTFLLQRYGIRDYSSATTEHQGDNLLEMSSNHPQASSTKNANQPKPNLLPADKLGCYFCNDIVAPGDSTLDRTLDQQCTVSRPGVSMMVSALAVELLASVMSSSLKSRTPAPIETHNDPSMLYEEDFGSDLGVVPHSIRGNLNRYHMYMPTSPSFNKCSACSQPVVNAYRDQGFEFLHRVFDDPNYLEEIAGLKDLQNVSDDVWALDSDELLFEDSV
uniref:Ubiquitin-like modifier-activating enzyme ATG7 n=1 Tax=Aceria tosichella TaxID=561515 RepID=A0A6G1SQD4_9ACAR